MSQAALQPLRHHQRLWQAHWTLCHKPLCHTLPVWTLQYLWLLNNPRASGRFVRRHEDRKIIDGSAQPFWPHIQHHTNHSLEGEHRPSSVVWLCVQAHGTIFIRGLFMTTGLCSGGLRDLSCEGATWGILWFCLLLPFFLAVPPTLINFPLANRSEFCVYPSFSEYSFSVWFLGSHLKAEGDFMV